VITYTPSSNRKFQTTTVHSESIYTSPTREFTASLHSDTMTPSSPLLTTNDDSSNEPD
jgi:hypothetical protein